MRRPLSGVFWLLVFSSYALNKLLSFAGRFKRQIRLFLVRESTLSIAITVVVFSSRHNCTRQLGTEKGKEECRCCSFYFQFVRGRQRVVCLTRWYDWSASGTNSNVRGTCSFRGRKSLSLSLMARLISTDYHGRSKRNCHNAHSALCHFLCNFFAASLPMRRVFKRAMGTWMRKWTMESVTTRSPEEQPSSGISTDN